MSSLDLLSRVLYINLSNKSFEVKIRKDLFEKYIGGTGVALQILNEETKPGIDPLSGENVVVLATGPLTGLFPLASKTVAVFKSPLTGNLGESHAGGRTAVAMRMAGYGAVVIKGVSRRPVYLSIRENRVIFKEATTIWGMNNCFKAGGIIRENEEGAGMRAIMRIGRGGENKVSFAAVTTETFRHFGRLGLGAVWGSKNLKGIAISGKDSIPVEDKKEFRKLYKELYDAAVESPAMKKYHDLGTSINVMSLNKLEALPTKNLKKSSFHNAEKISGERIAERFLGRRLACSHCPVGCIHVAALRELSEDEPYFFNTSMIGYDFELIYALGSMLGIDSAKGMLKLIDEVEKYCIDTMSTGVVLAWTTEAFEKGLITEKETDGLIPEWGDYKTYIELVDKLIEQPNDFYKTIAKGVSYASKKYGGEEFALAFGGNEMPGYHTGPAAYIGFLAGARHSHLDNAGYSLDQKMIASGKDFTPEEIAQTLVDEEGWRQVLSGLTICFFARGIYSKEVVQRALKISGLDKTIEEIDEIGRMIHKEKFKYKKREGFSFKNMDIPERIFKTKSPSIKFDRKYIEKALDWIDNYVSK